MVRLKCAVGILTQIGGCCAMLPPRSGRNLVDLATVAAAAASAALSETSPPSHMWLVKIAVRGVRTVTVQIKAVRFPLDCVIYSSVCETS